MPVPSEVLTNLRQSIAQHKNLANAGPKTKEQLLKVDDGFVSLIDQLREIEGFINLDTAEDMPVSSAMELWEKLPVGMHKQSPEVSAIVRSSKLLYSLYKKGIDFKKLYKFSEPEVQLARKVGDRFSDYSMGLSALRRAKEGKSKTEKQLLLTGTVKSAEFIKFLSTA
jgi:hypothetical protein